MWRWYRWFTAAFGLSWLLGAQGEPLATFECQEYIGRDWPRTQVTYSVAFDRGRVKPGKVRLVNAEGQDVVYQFWRVEEHRDGSIARARLSFMAELPKGGRYSCQLIAGRPESPVPPATTARREKGALVLDNGIVGVRLPEAGRQRFRRPLRFGAEHMDMVRLYGHQAEKGIAPGPLQGVRLTDGRWVGGSYFQAWEPEYAPKLLETVCAVTESGPLFTEAQVRYTFDGERHYQFTVQVHAGDPAIRIDEQFDMKRIGSTRDWRGYSTRDWQVVMSLTSGWEAGGWKPDIAFWDRYAYGNSMQPQKTAAEAGLKELGFDFSTPNFGTHRVTYDQPAAPLFSVEPWAPYGNFAAFFGLVESKALPQPSDRPATPSNIHTPIPSLVVMPVHAGNWRSDGPYSYKLFVGHKGDDAALHWPLDVLPHPNTFIHTGEYDPRLPYTFCRRQWHLIAGPLRTLKDLHAYRCYEGFIQLDHYKDWVLDWPDDARIDYPRMFFTRKDVAQALPTLSQHPAGSLLQNYLYVRDDEKRRKELYGRLTGPYGPLGQIRDDLSHWFTLWRQAHMTEPWAADMDEILSSPALTADERRTLRRIAAAFCYVVAHPDFNPRGTMAHLGNPNMAVVRFLALPFAAALIPDHPMAREWMDVSAQYVRYKLAMNTAPGGGWSELLTYYDACAPALMHAVNLLRQADRMPDDLARLAEQAATFPLPFLSPKDPRFGVRTAPCWGHEGRESFGQWLPTAGFTRHTRPDTARSMVWTWDQIGRLAGFHDGPFNARCVLYAHELPALPPDYVPERLQSAWIPGIGASLRAHAGDPQETWLSYRKGYMISHCDNNQDDFVLFAKGAPLVDMSLFAYGLHQHDPYIKLQMEFGWYSQARFGSRANAVDIRQGSNLGNTSGTWNPSSEIHAYHFSPSVDYLRGHSDYPPQCWTRQILFLKGKRAAGPNYFLFRDSADSLTGSAADLTPKWWNLRTVGTRDQVTVSAAGMNYASAFGPKLDVRFLEPAQVVAESRDEKREGNTYRPVETWRKNGEPILVGNQSAWGKIQESLTVTSFGPIEAGQDAVVALYPMGKEEAPPRYEKLSGGVARIATSEGTDWVFVDRKPMEFEQGDVAFRGLAGAVRVYPGEVHLAIAEGPGEVRYRGVVLRSGVPKTQVIPADQTGTPRVIDVPQPAPATPFRLATQGPSREIQPGVTQYGSADDFTIAFESDSPMTVHYEGMIRFTGRRGGIEVCSSKRTVRLVVLDGEAIGYQNVQAWGCSGPYEVTYGPERVVGRSAGLGRFLNLTKPPGLNRLVSLVLDGLPYAPGTSNTLDPAIEGRRFLPGPALPESALVVPLMPGEHTFELRNLEQPPVWRDWQAW